MSKRRRNSPGRVPIDNDGNVVRVPNLITKWRNGKDTFLAALTLKRHFRYGSARRLEMIDTATGVTYPIFLADFLDICKDVSMVSGEIRGNWGFCKKSEFYGVYLIEELSEE